MHTKRLLVIGHVWPEPTSSAAGWRMLQILRLFLSHGYDVSFACAATKSPHSYPLEEENITGYPILLNDSSFDDWVGTLSPGVVLFDRFMVEEQYGWRLADACPQAVRILDTEDLHHLRHARQEAFKKSIPWNDNLLYSDLAKREIAAILRSDLSLVISKEEIMLLKEKFQIPSSIISYLPFFEEKLSSEALSAWRGFAQRSHFVFIGNFLHEPNWKTVQLLKTVYWPKIRQQLPEAELHIYGAYPSQKVWQLHQPKEGFIIKGRAEDARQTISNYRILLAPIPFGAGLKGKFVDAMATGTPAISTAIGAEGMDQENWPGYICDNPTEFVDQAVSLYTDPKLWEAKQVLAREALTHSTANKQKQEAFIQQIETIRNTMEAHRNQNFIGQILQSQQHNSTRYMSLWIEEKNKK